MRRAVKNGPTKWPGANAVIDELGATISLASMDAAARETIANRLNTDSQSLGEEQVSIFFVLFVCMCCGARYYRDMF